MLQRARHLLDPDAVLALALADPIDAIQARHAPDDDAPVDAIRAKAQTLGQGAAMGLVALWRHIYRGGPLPLTYAGHEDEWRRWFEAEGLAPFRKQGLHAEPTIQPAAPLIDGRAPGPDVPNLPTEVDYSVTPAQQRVSDLAQQEAVDAWRAGQLRELRRLWAEGFQEGVANFAEQYPDLASEELLAELDAETADDEAMGPHFASVGKMVGELTNLLMAAPLVQQITRWFDDNAQRVQQQAETLAWQAEQRGYREAGAGQGMIIEWESEGDDRVCDDCQSLESDGPYTDEGGDNPLPAFPGDGHTQCGPNCRCSLNYIEPDQPGLAEAPAGDAGEPGAADAASSESLLRVLDVSQMSDLEGGSLADTLDAIALKTRNFDSEAGFALDKQGQILASTLGNADSLDFTQAELTNQYGAAAVVHNHPLSTSFSPSDVAFAYSQAVGAMHVLSPEWDYALRPALGTRFRSFEGALVIDAAQKRVDEMYPAVLARAKKAYEIQFSTPWLEAQPRQTFEQLFRRESKDFWHDVWTATAKDTGLFTYARTPAPKLAQMVHVTPAHVGGLPGLEAGKTPLPFDAWLDDLRARWSVEIEMSRRDLDGKNDLWTLSKIVVPKAERSSGIGSAVMKEVTARADQVGATLALTPSSAFGGSVGRLRTFYARFGFAKNSGSSRDLRISEVMVRAPKGGVTFPSLQEAQVKVLGQLPLTFPTKEASLLDMEKVGGPTGSNEGYWLHDKKFNLDYYVKPMDSAHAANEVGALRVYEAMGAVPGKDIPYAGVVKRSGDEPVVVSRKVEGLESHSSSWWEGNSVGAETARLDARRFWAVDALLSHYDVVGLANDNLLVRDGLAAHRVEAGGAMRYRAQGAVKNDWKVGAQWTEPWTMRGIAKDGVVPMDTVKPVFGTIGNGQAAEKLGTLKSLDLDALMKSWQDLGMSADERIHNLAVIKSRLAQIPAVQAQLGFKAAAPVPVEAKPAPAVASQVKYTPWNPKGDLWGNNLSVQLKPIFLDWKKEFAPVAGVATHIVEGYAAGVDLPVYKKTSAVYMKVRLAFAKSYNEALAGKAAEAPAVKEFWAQHLGLVETKSVDVQHVISTWLPKAKDETPVKTIATALPKWDQGSDPLGTSFLMAHPDWLDAAYGDKGVAQAFADFGSGSVGKGMAMTYNDFVFHSSAILDSGAASEVKAFWAKTLGDLPAQPMKVELIALAAAKEQALAAAKAGPYDTALSAAKDALSVGEQDAEDVMAELGTTFVEAGAGDGTVQDEFIHGLVKFGIAWNEESAANMVADWMATADLPVKFSTWSDVYEQAVKEHGQLGIEQQFTKPMQDLYATWKVDANNVSDTVNEFFAKHDAAIQAGIIQPSWTEPAVPKAFAWNKDVLWQKAVADEKAKAPAWFSTGAPSVNADSLWVHYSAYLDNPNDPTLGAGFKKWFDVKTAEITPVVEKGPVWLKPDKDAFAQFQQDKVEGVGHTTFADFKSTYDDWLAGGDQASWMPTPVTKWFDANMVKPAAPAVIDAMLPESIFGEQWLTAVDELGSATSKAGAGAIWNHIYQGGPNPLGKVSGAPLKASTVAKWKTWFEDHGLTPPSATELTKEEAAIAASQLPEVTAPQSTMTFTKQTTLLTWSPTNDKWASKFGKAHPKLYGSFSKQFKGAAWVDEVTKDLTFPASVLAPEAKTGVKESSIAWYKTAKARLQLKVAMAQTYNMAVKGQAAELTALDPKLAKFWASKLGEMGATVKAVGPVDASLANLAAVRDELKATHNAWYPEFRSQFGHSVTLKILPELANAEVTIPASSTRERELRALAFSKSYLMAKAGDVAGLRAIDEKLLYFWDEKLGGGLVPRVAVSLEGSPWVHDLNALYSKGGNYDPAAVEAKYARSNRASDFNSFKSGVSKFTGSDNVELRDAGVSVLKGAAGGRFGKSAKLMLEAIQDAPATAPALTRSESWASVASRAGVQKHQLADFLRGKVGTDFTFKMDMVSSQYAGHWNGDLKWHIEKGAKAIYAQPFSTHGTENEYIIAGRFKILRVEGGDEGNLHVYVRQVGVFDLPD